MTAARIGKLRDKARSLRSQAEQARGSLRRELLLAALRYDIRADELDRRRASRAAGASISPPAVPLALALIRDGPL